MTQPKEPSGPYRFRPPSAQDGKHIWELVQKTKVLDLNSVYLYMLLGHHFAATCVVAEQGNNLVGFVSGYLQPGHPHTYFLWQVGVHPEHQGQGLATQMVQQILTRPQLAHLQYLETTVSPSNLGSRRLFEKIAKQQKCALEELPGFPESFFPPGSQHEAEPLLRLGPFKSRVKRS
ncbi:MAG: diaminobutyrate acetyltransferase [Acidobacteria bacterium]|nr:diaminobutyrate acetyltransferase [Acidobacteriota bacterium]MCB9397965.1 diaminobutyrate acetyltransferase [Acidobacteriota bacterium]